MSLPISKTMKTIITSNSEAAAARPLYTPYGHRRAFGGDRSKRRHKISGRWFEPLPFVAFAAIALAFPEIAAADVFNIDEFAVTNNGTQIFDDSFNRTLTLTGGSGTILSSGTNFENGFESNAAANYFVRGTITETTANNGQAQLNTADGEVITQPDPFIPVIQQVSANLETGSNLTAAHTFSAVGLFDLAVPSTVLGTYDVALVSSTLTVQGRELQMRVRETNTGPVLQFEWLDFADNLATTIDQVAITPAELAHPQLELALSLNTANSDVVTAYYAFGSGNTLASFNTSLTAFGSTGGSTDVFTPTLDSVRAGFNAFTPVVPEPSTWSMIAVGGVALFGLMHRKKHSAG